MSKRGEKKAKYYGRNLLSDDEIVEKIQPLTPGLSEKYIQDSLSYEYSGWDGGRIYPINEENDSIKRILNRALLLERLDETAKDRGIDPIYIHKFATRIEVDKKGAFRRIINRALKEQKEDGGLTSRLVLFIAAISALITGLFFLSSNFTGNAISNVSNLDSSIMGTILFGGGLIAGFFWLRKNKY